MATVLLIFMYEQAVNRAFSFHSHAHQVLLQLGFVFFLHNANLRLQLSVVRYSLCVLYTH